VVRTDRYGFPRGTAGRIKRVSGTWTGRLAGIRADGRLDIQTALKKVTVQARHFHLLQHGDGYAYA
jgi:hypothetical protein